MVADSSSLILALGGIVTSLITAGGAFAGIVYNARHQRRPRVVKVDADELAKLRNELREANRHEHELARELERWRSMAMALLNQRTE